MTKKKKDWQVKIFESVENHPVRSILCFLLVGVFTQLFIQLLYCLGKWKGFPTDYSAGEVLTFWGSFFAFVGTLALGALAYYQNKKLNDINERLLEIQEAKLCPMIDIASFYKGRPIISSEEAKSTKDVIMIELDRKICEIMPNNEIKNYHDDITWVFECENTSEIKIIKIIIREFVVSYHYSNGKQEKYSPKSIGSSEDECLNPHENKPLIISGIKLISPENPGNLIPPKNVSLIILCTNAIGDSYKQSIDFDVVDEFTIENGVSFPGVFNKKYSKPKKIR